MISPTGAGHEQRRCSHDTGMILVRYRHYPDLEKAAEIVPAAFFMKPGSVPAGSRKDLTCPADPDCTGHSCTASAPLTCSAAYQEKLLEDKLENPTV